MKKWGLLFSAFALGLSTLTAFSTPAFAATTVVVTGNTSAGENQPGWLFNRDITTSTTYDFSTAEAKIGTGSLYAGPITNTNFSGFALNQNWDKFIAENFLRAELGDINSISYDFMIGSGGDINDDAHFYMNVYANYADTDPNNFYDCRYNVVPTVGSTSDWTTLTFDPTLTYSVATRVTSPVQPCPSTPADMGEDAFVRVFALNMGDTSASDTGLDGYFDNVVVDLTSGSTTYDFEPAVGPPTSKDECKKGGWASFNSPEFKNQGDCVSHVASDGKAKGNPVVNFLRSIF